MQEIVEAKKKKRERERIGEWILCSKNYKERGGLKTWEEKGFNIYKDILDLHGWKGQAGNFRKADTWAESDRSKHAVSAPVVKQDDFLSCDRWASSSPSTVLLFKGTRMHTNISLMIFDHNQNMASIWFLKISVKKSLLIIFSQLF